MTVPVCPARDGMKAVDVATIEPEYGEVIVTNWRVSGICTTTRPVAPGTLGVVIVEVKGTEPEYSEVIVVY
jgi:hypothetical protein